MKSFWTNKIFLACVAGVVAVAAVCAIVIPIALSGGAKDLAKPVLTVSGTTVSWAAVENAKDYTVNVDGTDKAAQTELSYSLADYPVGNHTVKVRANTGNEKKFKTSAWSDIKTVVVDLTLSLEDFIAKISDVKGNYVVNFEDGVTKIEVNGTVSHYTDSSQDTYCRIVDSTCTDSYDFYEVWYYYPENYNYEANVNDFHTGTCIASLIHDYTADDFTSEGNTHTSEKFDVGFGIGDFVIVCKSDGSVEFSYSDNADNIITCTITFGTATLTFQDIIDATAIPSVATPVLSFNDVSNKFSWAFDHNASGYEMKVGASGTPFELSESDITITKMGPVFVASISLFDIEELSDLLLQNTYNIYLRGMGDGTDYSTSEWSSTPVTLDLSYLLAALEIGNNPNIPEYAQTAPADANALIATLLESGFCFAINSNMFDLESPSSVWGFFGESEGIDYYIDLLQTLEPGTEEFEECGNTIMGMAAMGVANGTGGLLLATDNEDMINNALNPEEIWDPIYNLLLNQVTLEDYQYLQELMSYGFITDLNVNGNSISGTMPLAIDEEENVAMADCFITMVGSWLFMYNYIGGL